MSAPTTEQLQSELNAIFLDAPPALHGNTRWAVPGRPRSLNALQHGLSGQHVLVGPEEIQSYARMALEYMRSLKPMGALETGNAQLYFEDRWRLHRILSVENDLFYIDRPQPGSPPDLKPENAAPSLRKPGIARQVNAFREEARNIDLISRYETRLLRNSGRLMEEIRALRSERAKVDPDSTYDEQTDPAAAWYRRILAQAERISAAREQQAEREQHAERVQQAAAVDHRPTQSPAGSVASGETSLGKNDGAAPDEWPESTPQWDGNPRYDRDFHSCRSAISA